MDNEVKNEVTKEAKQRLNVFSIRPYINSKGEKKSEWIKIGVAFVNNDGSMNVKCSCLPVDGEFHIRAPKEDDKDQQ